MTESRFGTLHAQPSRSRPTAGAGRLLELVRTGQATTRAELVRDSGLARATVADRLDLLLDAGLVTFAGTVESTGGRRPSALRFNERAGVVLVAHLGATGARLAACDLAAGVLAEERHPIDIGAGPEPTLTLIRERLAVLLEQAGRRGEDVLGVAVGVPGPVDVRAGKVVAPPIMTGWDGVEIPAALALPYRAPVLVDNDVNLMALGEQRAVLPEEQHLIFVKVATGVGMGIVAAGQLYRGADGAAGDIGHTPGPGLDALCRCGMRGCIESKAGGWALARDLRELGHDVRRTPDVVDLIRRRDPDAISLLRDAGRVLGTAMTSVVSVLNPSSIVLGGEIAHADEQLAAGVREVVYARALPLATRTLRVSLSRLGEQAGVIGSAHLVIEHRLAPAAVDEELARRFDPRAAAA